MPEPIPQFTLDRQHAALAPELEAAARRVLASGRFVQGPEVEALERELAAELDPAAARPPGAAPLRIIACGNGTDALHLALRAAGIGPGARVVAPGFTFFATLGAALLTGAEVECLDVSPATFNLDPAPLEAALARRPAALIAVHLYGRMAPMAEILRLAAAAGAPVIEDAAQSFGARAAAGAAGTIGLAGCFSFYPTKNLGGLGEGGAVATRDAALADRLRQLRSHGGARRYEHLRLGWNARMDELQAALLRVKLPRVAAWNARRREVAARYEQALLAGGAAIPDSEEAAAPAERILLPRRSLDHVFHQYTIRAPRRDALREHLRARGIGSEIYYPLAAHRQPALPGGDRFHLPVCDLAAREALSLPMFPELRDDEVERIAAAVGDFVGAGWRE